MNYRILAILTNSSQNIEVYIDFRRKDVSLRKTGATQFYILYVTIKIRTTYVHLLSPRLQNNMAVYKILPIKWKSWSNCGTWVAYHELLTRCHVTTWKNNWRQEKRFSRRLSIYRSTTRQPCNEVICSREIARFWNISISTDLNKMPFPCLYSVPLIFIVFM